MVDTARQELSTYLVGGAVRDKLLGLPVSDRDWVVVGSSPEQMLAQGFKAVGQAFPVYLHPETQEEYALARTERKVGPGYQGFDFYYAPDVSLIDDLRRRDLTINAMALDETEQIIDPYGGQQDIQNKQLRHVSEAFVEDPVRILRVARFAARFKPLGFSVAAETLQLMQEMVARGEANALVAERVWQEIERALNSSHPSVFWQVLQEAGALAVLWPELTQLWSGETAQGSLWRQLERAQQETQLAPEIFFALLFIDPDTHLDTDVQLALIQASCQRWRVPKVYRELVELVGRTWRQFTQVSGYSADQVVELLTSLDSYRRSERFGQWLAICRLLEEEESSTRVVDRLQRAHTVCSALSAKQWVEQGYRGLEIQQQLRKARIEALLQSGLWPH